MNPPLLPLMLLMGVSVTWYIGQRLLAERVLRRASVTWQAILFAMPLGLLTVFAVVQQRPLLAMHAVLAAAGMTMTASLGLTLLAQPRGAESPGPWLWPIPAGLMLLLLGTGGLLSPSDCGVVLLFGLLCLSASRRSLPPPALAVEAPVKRPIILGPLVVWPLALGMLTLGAFLAVRSAKMLSISANRSLDALLAIVILGPAVVLPLTMQGMTLARRERSEESISLLTLFSTLAATILLPASIVAASLRLRWPSDWSAWLREPARVMLSLPSVRLSGVALAAGGLLLVPMVLGRRRPGALEAVLLVTGSLVYLVLQALSIL